MGSHSTSPYLARYISTNLISNNSIQNTFNLEIKAILSLKIIKEWGEVEQEGAVELKLSSSVDENECKQCNQFWILRLIQTEINIDSHNSMDICCCYWPTLHNSRREFWVAILKHRLAIFQAPQPICCWLLAHRGF